MNAPALATLRLDGKAISERVRAEIESAVDRITTEGGRVPGLATVLVGNDPASEVYVRNKREKAGECFFFTKHVELPASASTADVLAVVADLNADDAIDGILVQLPLPKQVDEHAVLLAIDPDKDVDGFHPENVARLTLGLKDAFVPCTPLGCLRLLEEAGVALKGAHAVVVGRSNIVGKPMAALLLQKDCTVTIAHSRTKDLAAVTRTADIIVAAVGRPNMITREHIKPGAVVIDVGINRVPKDGGGTKLVGDVDWESIQGVASAATPVPGGVGPMTIAMLLQNTLTSNRRRRMSSTSNKRATT
jgi:methylenetetrahydrofolate dehydrogenase (NADP+)/methenyltetrahydrofolate cyclohydrolase